MIGGRRPWLGQVQLKYYEPPAAPPYWGEWGVIDEETGEFLHTGKVGPFGTVDEAFQAASKAAVDHGALKMPLDGFAQARDSQGNPVGPMI